MKATRSRHLSFSLILAVSSTSLFSVLAACTDDSAIHENVPQDSGVIGSSDSGMTDSGGTVVIGPDSSIPVNCFAGDAQTYEEIINACTTSVKIDKHPTLPLLQADGGLPLLP
ncbi:MAG: hypothetical protein ABI183_00630 [Polyangiaceae bacterium]